MKGLGRQKGSALIGYATLALTTAGIATYYSVQQKSAARDGEIVKQVSEQIEQLQSAQLACYADLRRWCTAAELPTYNPGNTVSYGGNPITFNQVGNDLEFVVNVGSSRRANALRQIMPGGSATNSTLRTNIRPPSDTSIYSQRLQRYANNIDGSRTTFASDLLLGSNAVDAVDVFQASNVDGDTVTANTLTANTVQVNSQIDVGGNTLTNNGNDIVLAANDIELGGNVTAQQNVQFNGTDVRNVDNVNADAAVFSVLDATTITSVNGNIVDASVLTGNVSTVNASNATVTDLTVSGSLTFTTASVDTLNTPSLDVTSNATINSADITAVNANAVQFSNGQIRQGNFDVLGANSINSDSALALTANLNQADITSLTGSYAGITNAAIGDLTATGVQSDTVTVSGQSQFSNLLSASGNFVANRLNANGGVVANDAEFTDANITLANVDDVDATMTQYAYVDNLTATNATGQDLIGDTATVNNIYVAGLVTTSDLVVDTLLSQQYYADDININSATLAAVYASSGIVNGNTNAASIDTASMSVTNTLQANELAGGNANINTFNVNTLNSSTVTAHSTLYASNMSGNQFAANDDFYTANTSVDTNAGNLQALYTAIDGCVNSSGYCVANAPDFTVNCFNCNQSSTASVFVAEIRVNITECAQGCSLSFNLAGLSPVTGCNTVSYSPGYTGQQVCRVTDSLNPGDVVDVNAIVTLVNSRRPSQQSAVAANVRFQRVGGITPVFDLNCKSCFLQSSDEVFSSEIDVNITQCDYGCTLTFDLDGLTPGNGCGPQSFNAGYTGTVTCRVSTSSVPNDTLVTFSPVVSLENSVLQGNIAQNSTSVSYENTTPGNNFGSIVATCFVDTDQLDIYTGVSYCAGEAPPEEVVGVSFTVGDSTDYSGGSYYYSNESDYSFEWSGFCDGTERTCLVMYSVSPLEYLQANNAVTYLSTVTVTHIPTGDTYTETVSVTLNNILGEGGGGSCTFC